MTITEEPVRKALDFTSLLSAEARSRKSSPLKTLVKYLKIDGMISLGAGMPHPTSFIFDSISVSLSSMSPEKVDPKVLNITKETSDKVTVGTGEILQYMAGRGNAHIQNMLYEYIKSSHHPIYEDWDIVFSCGNTDGLAKCISLLCERGDFCLTDKWTYPAAIETMIPMGVQPVGIEMDEEGIIATDLALVLDNWDVKKRGANKPKIIYLVPTGQNPTGATMSLVRRHEIYSVCQRHNIIIIEDDPYYYMAFRPWSDPSSTVSHPTPKPAVEKVPSFLSLDTDGRVIRLDSFAKITAPGIRAGIISCNQKFAQIIIWHQETTVQNTNGFSQAILAQLFSENGWGMEGWNRHLLGLQEEYEMRRNWFIFYCQKYLDERLVRYSIPSAGMFVWFEILPISTPSLGLNKHGISNEDFFMKLIDAKVLVVPGHSFSTDSFGEWEKAPFFRTSFAYPALEHMETALKTLGRVLKECFDMH